jgi:hypothetical protein
VALGKRRNLQSIEVDESLEGEIDLTECLEALEDANEGFEVEEEE